MKRDKWIWMGHPGHFIAAQYCKFFLNTYVGKYIVSTVGEYLPDEGVREIFSKTRNKPLEGIGDARLADYMKKIGYEELHSGGYFYETMVFKAKRADKELCCPWRQVSGANLDFTTDKTAEEALVSHMKLCAKWSKKS